MRLGACRLRAAEECGLNTVDERAHLDEVDGQILNGTAGIDVVGLGGSRSGRRVEIRVEPADTSGADAPNYAWRRSARDAEDVEEVVHGTTRGPDPI